MNRIDVSDLEVGTTIVSTYLVDSVEIRETANGSPFVAYTMSDRTGAIQAKHWECEDVLCPVGSVAKVQAAVGSYRERPDLKIVQIREFTEVEDVSPFVRVSEIPLDELLNEFGSFVDLYAGRFSTLIRDLLVGEADGFKDAPAAKQNHHAFKHGLFEHIVSMCKVALDLSAHYGREMYADPIDRELLIAGVILHDLGKVADFDRVGLGYEINDRYRLVGHIPTCVQWIESNWQQCGLTQADADDLTHMVLSHHGRLEWGSPVTPKLREAFILHAVDKLDADLAMYRDATRGKERGEWVYVRTLGGEVRA